MKPKQRFAAPPKKPILFYDSDCNFCTRWIKRWQRCTGDFIDYVPSQNCAVRSNFPELPDEVFNESIQLIVTDGKVFSGAEAVFRSLALGQCKRWPLWFYEKIPGVAPLTEWLYRRVAKNRSFFSSLSRLIWRD